jgi:DNA-binding transcriptional LysR family regulator
MRRPKVKLDHLSTIICLAEKRNIEDAADELGLTPSAIRKQIDAIESLFGVRIFKSGPGGFSLTDYGDVLHTQAQRTLDQALLAEEKLRTLQALRDHRVLIGHSTYLPPKMIAMIHQVRIDDMPRLRIEHTSGTTKTVVEEVISGRLHVGFGFLPVQEPTLQIHPLFEEPLVVCMPSNHRLASRALVYPHDLDGEPVIAVGRIPMPALHLDINDHFSEFGIELHIIIDAFSPTEALAYVVQKVGICLLASSSVITRPGITVRPLSTRVLKRRSGVFIREDNRSPLLQKVLEAVFQKTNTARSTPQNMG